MSTVSEITGRIVSGPSVRAALDDALKTWLLAYLAEIERQVGLPQGDLPEPVSWERPIDPTKVEAKDLPMVYVTPARLQEPSSSGQGYTGARWRERIVTMQKDADRERAEDRASYYTTAARAVLFQQATAYGPCEHVAWIGEDYATIHRYREFTVAAGAMDLLIATPPAVRSHPYPREVPSDPYAGFPEEETVESTHVTIERE